MDNNKNSMWLLVIGILLILAVAFFALRGFDAGATIQRVEECGDETTGTFEQDFDGQKVDVDFGQNDITITVTAEAGYELVKTELDVTGDGQGLVEFPVQDGVTFNPPGINSIKEARVTVRKVCETPSPEPSPEPSPVVNDNGGDDEEEGDESSTQDTDCANLDALTEEQALGDCGESKVEPTPEPTVQARTLAPAVVQEEPLEVFPSTGYSLGWF